MAKTFIDGLIPDPEYYRQKKRRKIILSMLDTVYIDPKKTKSFIAIKPKPPFRPIFQVAVSKKNSNIRISNEPLKGSVFVVETGEAGTLLYRSVFSLVKERRALIVEFQNKK